jgi:hypothetical protein
LRRRDRRGAGSHPRTGMDEVAQAPCRRMTCWRCPGQVRWPLVYVVGVEGARTVRSTG